MAGNHNPGTDLMGFPAGEARRLEEERLARIHNPNFNPGSDWTHLKANAEMFKKDLAIASIPNRIPESLFVRNFLDMMATLYTRDPNKMQAVDDSGNIYRWVQIAGQPYRHVEVFSDQDKTKTIFTVPPIFRRTKSILNRDPNICFLAMIHKAQQVAGRNPRQGEQFYNEALLQFTPRDSKDHFLADQVQWLVIFDHYSVPLWDQTTKTYKTVKELRALEGIKLFNGQAGHPVTEEPTKTGVKTSGACVQDNEDF